MQSALNSGGSSHATHPFRQDHASCTAPGVQFLVKGWGYTSCFCCCGSHTGAYWTVSASPWSWCAGARRPVSRAGTRAVFAATIKVLGAGIPRSSVPSRTATIWVDAQRKQEGLWELCVVGAVRCLWLFSQKLTGVTCGSIVPDTACCTHRAAAHPATRLHQCCSAT